MSALAETRNAVLTHLDAEFQRRLVHVRNCQKRQVVRHLATDHPCKSGMCMRPSKSTTNSSDAIHCQRQGVVALANLAPVVKQRRRWGSAISAEERT